MVGRCAIPATARAISLNVAVTGATAPGHLTFYPSGVPAPNTSTINFRAASARANNAIVPLGQGGAIDVLCVQSPGNTAQVIIDVSGYFR
jgi:hypothetical protein